MEIMTAEKTQCAYILSHFKKVGKKTVYVKKNGVNFALKSSKISRYQLTITLKCSRKQKSKKKSWTSQIPTESSKE